MDLRGIELNGMDWINLVQDSGQWRTVLNTVMNLRISENVGKFLSS
jgi:hypothetical protein